MALETELKFQIPATRLAAVRRALATASARVQPLAARYFDTGEARLAAARVALRLRNDGGDADGDPGAGWVQTLKAELAGSAFTRLEHNVALPAGTEPVIDPSRHDGHAAGALLRRALAAHPAKAAGKSAGKAAGRKALADGAPALPGDDALAALQECYRTDVQRTLRRLRSGGALIELALDEGVIVAGERRLGLCELEFELIDGPPQALLALAARWAQRFGLLLDVRSKSERGHLLAAGRLLGPPVMARPLALPRGATWPAARSAMLTNPLQQVLANAAMLADATPGAAAEPEHLHQLRVGLRRLRSVLAIVAQPPGDAAPAADVGATARAAEIALVREACATLFGALGAARDEDALAAWLWPGLQAAGAPPALGQLLAQPRLAAADATPAELLRRPGTQQLWLRLLGLATDAAPQPAIHPAGAPAAQALRAAAHLAPLLGRLQRQVRRDARRVAALDDDARHRLRRRIKRLRYLAELSQGLWPARRCKRLLAAVKSAQEPLGLYNDGVIALAHCEQLAQQSAEAWFAVGWLRARQPMLLAQCAQALAVLARQKSAFVVE